MPFPPVDIPRVLDLVVPLQRAFVLAAKRFARFVQNIVQALADRGFPAVFGVISCLKGENARIAGKARQRFGTVHVLDPFEVSGMPSAAYNPLDRLTPDSLDLGEDAASLTEALVMDPPGQVSEAHWNEEAKAILGGLIMFCVCHEDRNRRSLATVREYLTLPRDRVRALLELMQDSDAAGGLIARAANRFLGKADREAASVLSNAQRHTHFLDSPRIANVLSRSDFHFSDLRHRITSVFLVLPPNRMDAYSRWLRLLVSQALQDIARDAEASVGAHTPSQRLRTPVLFLLDEFAALGRLEAVERAMGLMRDRENRAERLKRVLPWFGLGAVVLALAMTVALPRFLASYPSTCAVIGGIWRTTTTGVDACVFYQP